MSNFLKKLDSILFDVILETDYKIGYHRTASYHSIVNMVSTGKYSSASRTRREKPALSTFPSLKMMKDWDFGSYILKVGIPSENVRTCHNEIQIEGDLIPLQWGIILGPDDILWFNIDNLKNFDYALYDERVLQAASNGNWNLALSWAKDFYGGDWLALNDKLVDPEWLYNNPARTWLSSDLSDFRNAIMRLSPKDRQKFLKLWNYRERSELYGLEKAMKSKEPEIDGE